MPRPTKDIRCARRPETGRCSIMYREHPGHWFATPESDEVKALQWARRSKERLLAKTETEILFKTVAKDFFAPDGKWQARAKGKGHTFSKPYLQNRQGHIDNYLIPTLGDMPLRLITRRIIDDAILTASRVSGSGKPLAPATKEKIVYAANLLFEEFVDAGFITMNPIIGITHYDRAPVAPRGAIPIEALGKIYPDGHCALVKVWGGSMWAALFCYLNDTGNRPGEARALKWKELDINEHFVVVRHGIAAKTVDTIKGTKTDIIKPAFLSDRTMDELAIWRTESKYSSDDDFIFSNFKGDPVSSEGIIKAFRRGLKAAASMRLTGLRIGSATPSAPTGSRN